MIRHRTCKTRAPCVALHVKHAKRHKQNKVPPPCVASLFYTSLSVVSVNSAFHIRRVPFSFLPSRGVFQVRLFRACVRLLSAEIMTNQHPGSKHRLHSRSTSVLKLTQSALGAREMFARVLRFVSRPESQMRCRSTGGSAAEGKR